MHAFVFVTLLAVFTTSASVASDLSGSWRGTWTKAGDALPVALNFEKTGDSWYGAFDSDALQVAGIPFSDVSDTSGRVHFRIVGDRTTTVFDGAIANDRMSGAFVDGDDTGAFDLIRAAPAASAIHTRDVTFKGKGVTLAGTLILPSAPGKHPAVVFLHGSGDEGRWANRYLAQKFAERGVVALVYDKRGVGQSDGDWQKTTPEELADDTVAGIGFVQSQSEVDATRVGIYGHSQGGTIAPLVGVREGGLSFIVASAAAGGDLADVEEYSVGNSIGVATLPPAERADAREYVRAIVDVAYRGKDRSSLDAEVVRFRDRTWYFAPPPAGNYYWWFSKQVAAFRPAEYWRRITAPVLPVYGERDERVPPRDSADTIRAALKSGGNGSVTLKTWSGADHTFTIVNPPPRKGGWPKHEPDYANTVVKWVLAQPANGKN